jgi:hypothetical protein
MERLLSKQNVRECISKSADYYKRGGLADWKRIMMLFTLEHIHVNSSGYLNKLIHCDFTKPRDVVAIVEHVVKSQYTSVFGRLNLTNYPYFRYIVGLTSHYDKVPVKAGLIDTCIDTLDENYHEMMDKIHLLLISNCNKERIWNKIDKMNKNSSRFIRDLKQVYHSLHSRKRMLTIIIALKYLMNPTNQCLVKYPSKQGMKYLEMYFDTPVELQLYEPPPVVDNSNSDSNFLTIYQE